MEIYHKAGLAFVSPSNTNSTVTDRGYLEVNRVVGRDDGQGIAGAQFAKAQNFTGVYIVYQSSDFAKKNADNFKREADRTGAFLVIDDNPALADLAGPLLVDGGGTYYTSIAVPASLTLMRNNSSRPLIIIMVLSPKSTPRRPMMRPGFA